MYILILTIAAGVASQHPGGVQIHSIRLEGGIAVCEAAKTAWLAEQRNTGLTSTAACVKATK